MAFPYKGVLFLCRGNAVRSQMAEGFFRAFAPGACEVWSAGAAPIGLDERAVTVMSERGLDISGHRSKGIEEIPAEKVDLVVTLCGVLDDSCPRFTGKAVIRHWPLPDPYLSPPLGPDGLDTFRSVRDEIEKRVRGLLGTAVGEK